MIRVVTAMRNQLIVVALLIVEDVVIGSGLGVASILVGFTLLIIYFANRQKSRRQLILAAVYTVAGIASFAVIQINWRIAEARSKPIIAACKGFHTKYEHYPKELSELIPEFIPAIPHAGYTLTSRRFLYISSRSAVGFAVMFHGVAFYDFQENKWQTADK